MKGKYKQQMPVIAEDIFGLQNNTDFSKITDKMYTPDDPEMITDLTPKAISKLNILYQYSIEYDTSLLSRMCDKFILLRVSTDRKGRGEAVSMATAILGMKTLEMREKMIESAGGKK